MVPPAYQGVWVRTLLEQGELRDERTQVYWLQACRWHADLRIPQPAPGEAPWSADQRQRQQQGFAGWTEVQTIDGRDVCSWHREFDLQPPTADADEGYMHFESSERVVETGVHASYLEIWERLPGSTGRQLALEMTEPDGTTRRMLIAGEFATQVRPRRAAWPADTCAPDTLEQAGKAGEVLVRGPGDVVQSWQLVEGAL
ncbi:hypothetical protein T492DRAFT_1138851 [Pavlovales sp. CCMP2436]|nr:hypothetical protein T492DRAFT_1138851 [Pavlovales sp. CCMP2436]